MTSVWREWPSPTPACHWRTRLWRSTIVLLKYSWAPDIIRRRSTCGPLDALSLNFWVDGSSFRLKQPCSRSVYVFHFAPVRHVCSNSELLTCFCKRDGRQLPVSTFWVVSTVISSSIVIFIHFKCGRIKRRKLVGCWCLFHTPCSHSSFLASYVNPGNVRIMLIWLWLCE